MGHELIVNVIPALTSLILITTQPLATPSSQFGLLPTTETNLAQYVWQVKAGETLEDIAKSYYGNESFWTKLWNDNPWIDDPNYIEEGWKLKLQSPPTIQNEPLVFDLTEKLLLKTPIDKNTNLSNLRLRNFITKTSPTPFPAQTLVLRSASQTELTTQFDDVYKQAGAKFGVPWQILYGIHLTETGLRDGTIYNAQGSGAQGPMQFMPGTFQAYAVSASGNSKPDINSAKDAIFTAANYIAKHGSVENALASYGGNFSGALAAARNRGYTQ